MKLALIIQNAKSSLGNAFSRWRYPNLNPKVTPEEWAVMTEDERAEWRFWEAMGDVTTDSIVCAGCMRLDEDCKCKQENEK